MSADALFEEDPERLLERLLAKDATLWRPGSKAPVRLGWLELPRTMEPQLASIETFATSVEASRALLIGMGGSALGAAVLAQATAWGTLPTGESPSGPSRRAERVPAAGDTGRPAMSGSHLEARTHHARSARHLMVLDTTHPATVRAIEFDDAFVVVSSKSGTTLEPRALFAHAWAIVGTGDRFAAVTDPGTPLAELARLRGFAHCFEAPPDVGGRYSVLSPFGLVPGALAGSPLAAVLEGARGADLLEATRLGLEIGQAALEGRDKLTIVVPEELAAFGLWAEQLVAESTGKDGRGVVPVPTTEPERGEDRFVLEVRFEGPLSVGEQFMRLEVATAVAGHVLGIDPFDEPNVAEAKERTAKALASLPVPEVEPLQPDRVLSWLESVVHPGDYVALHAYLPFGLDAELEQLRRAVRDRLGGMAVTVGYAPRLLHSTGQLHKGGPDSVVAVQLVSASPGPVVPVPGEPFDFATLIAAQALGDYESLRSRGRRVVRTAVDDPLELLG
jgi:glucose-6-phosphate isomerase